VTLVGVAHRGKIALEDIAVDFEIAPSSTSGSAGFEVREKVTLYGDISESERVRLERASGFCPVGQALNKGSMQIEDEVCWSAGEAVSASPVSADLQPYQGTLPAIPPGTVHAKYLLDTQEHDEKGEMAHEGEAKVTIRCANLQMRQPEPAQRVDSIGGPQLSRVGAWTLPALPRRLGRFYRRHSATASAGRL
jgi:hypothetical protein